MSRSKAVILRLVEMLLDDIEELETEVRELRGADLRACDPVNPLRACDVTAPVDREGFKLRPLKEREEKARLVATLEGWK